MGTITTHVLDTGLGTPARDLRIKLEAYIGTDDTWLTLTERVTNGDGRVEAFTDDLTIVAGIYRITFFTEDYFKGLEQVHKWFYPKVQVDFEIEDVEQHYHVPLLISPFGYSTYRGS